MTYSTTILSHHAVTTTDETGRYYSVNIFENGEAELFAYDSKEGVRHHRDTIREHFEFEAGDPLIESMILPVVAAFGNIAHLANPSTSAA